MIYVKWKLSSGSDTKYHAVSIYTKNGGITYNSGTGRVTGSPDGQLFTKCGREIPHVHEAFNKDLPPDFNKQFCGVCWNTN